MTFAVLAVGTYRHGLRTPTVVAVAKGVLLFAGTALLVGAVLHRFGGVGRVFDEAALRLGTGPARGCCCRTGAGRRT